MADVAGERGGRAAGDPPSQRNGREPDWDPYDTDLVWTTRPDGPAHFTYRGLDGPRRGSRSMRQVWAELHGEILEVVDSDEVVVSVIRWHLRGRSGAELDEVEGWVTCVRDQIGRCRGQRGELRGNGGAQDIAR